MIAPSNTTLLPKNPQRVQQMAAAVGRLREARECGAVGEGDAQARERPRQERQGQEESARQISRCQLHSQRCLDGGKGFHRGVRGLRACVQR